MLGGGKISTQPVVANNLVYWGTWDGIEHATPLPGSLASGWATNLGAATSSTATGCSGSTIGVASTGAVATVTPTGQTSPRSVLFVGGGGTNTAGGGSAQLYALDALTGSVLWHTPLGPSPNNFMWSSPAVYTYTNSSGATVTSVYVGVASFGDCPLVQGQVVQLDATSGQMQHVFDVVPSGCTGGGVWGSPTIDQSDGSLYVATGNPGSCSSAQPYGEALVKLRASDLSVLGSWQIPGNEKTSDGDFGAAPTLFSGTVSPGGTLRSLVGVPDKNGVFYVFDRSQVSAGPVAKPHVAVAGDCPQCGKGSISPGAWDGTTLYVAGGNTTIKGTSYAGSLRAFNPNNLSTPLWEDGLDGSVLGAVAAAPGLAVVGEGHYTVVVDASNGNVLLRAPVNSISTSSPAIFYGAPSIAFGTLFEGDTHGYLYAYTVPETRPTVKTEPASSVTAISATLNGVVNPNGSEVTECKLEYGTTLPSASSVPCTPAPGAGTGNVAVAGAISGLTEKTTYHFRVIAKNTAGTSEGAEAEFKTASSTPVKPTVKTEPASSVTANSATLNGLVNPNGFEVTECKLEYGTTLPSASSVPCTPAPGAGTGNVAVAGAISGLTENTTYQFRVIAKNTAGTSEGAAAEFKTKTATGPVTVASDSFNRTVSAGWGTAEVGGSWTVLDTPADWSVTPGIGSISVPAGGQQRAVLSTVSVQNVSLLAKIVLPRCTGSGTNCNAYLLGRVSGGTSPTYYRVGVVQGAGSSTISLRAQRSDGSNLSSDLNTGIAAANGAVVWLRVEFQGTNPTTIRARAWLEGTSEPTAWLLSTTDSTAAEQVAGAIGVRARNEDTAASHTFDYESLRATET